MLLLTKSISQLLLPPGIFIVLGIISLLFWKKTWARGLLAFSLILLCLLSTEPVRDALTRPLEYQYSPLKLEALQQQNIVIVVLGGGLQESSPEYQGSDELGHNAMMRTIFAAKVHEASGLPIYATGGTPLTESAEAEADVMKRWLIWFGVPENKIASENKANTTWENATLTQKLLSKKGINSIVLVTSAWHMPRAVWCFEQQGLTVSPAPTDYLTKRTAYDLRSYLPRWDTLNDSGNALHEYLGLFFYYLKY